MSPPCRLLVACAALLLARTAAATECGVPSAKHPPGLTIKDGSLVGLKQGIAYGAVVEPHSYPWSTVVNGCTAAIVGDKWVLTAAHCVTNGQGEVPSDHVGNSIVGLHHKNTDPGRTYKAEKVHVLPAYNGDACGSGNDLALVELRESIEFNDEVRPICLPSESDNYNDQEGAAMLAAGWGFNNKNETGDDQLKHVVMYVNKAECIRSYGGAMDKETCVTGRLHGQGICKGDSGGSLMHIRDGRFYTTGVAMCAPAPHHDTCDPTTFHPASYLHLPDYMGWVRRTMGN